MESKFLKSLELSEESSEESLKAVDAKIKPNRTEYFKRYYQENKTHIRASQTKYQNENRERNNERRRIKRRGLP